MEIIEDGFKIDKYQDGFIITITDKNWTKIGNYKTPCYIQYEDHLIELHNEYFIYHKNDFDDEICNGETFQRILPQLLKSGKLLPRDENNDPILIDK